MHLERGFTETWPETLATLQALQLSDNKGWYFHGWEFFWKLLNYDHVPWGIVFLGYPLLISHCCSANVEARVTNEGGRQRNDLESWGVFGIWNTAYGIGLWASLLLTCPAALATAHVVSCSQLKYDCAIICLHSSHSISQKPFTLSLFTICVMSGWGAIHWW